MIKGRVRKEERVADMSMVEDERVRSLREL
jgi:hypothetical protein